MQGRIHLVKTGVVVDVQHPVHLRQMPPETTCQIGLGDSSVSHTLIEDYLDGG